jgi:NitT/TauT family transport system substrate-binding protein
MAAQLAAGKIVSAVMPEPFATQAISLNPSIRSPIDLGALWTEETGLESYPMSLFVVSARLASSRPDLIDALEKAYRSSIERTVADPGASARLAESLDLGMKAAVAQAAIPRSAYVYLRAGEARKSIEAMLSLFLASDPQSVGGRLPDSAFYN